MQAGSPVALRQRRLAARNQSCMQSGAPQVPGKAHKQVGQECKNRQVVDHRQNLPQQNEPRMSCCCQVAQGGHRACAIARPAFKPWWYGAAAALHPAADRFRLGACLLIRWYLPWTGVPTCTSYMHELPHRPAARLANLWNSILMPCPTLPCRSMGTRTSMSWRSTPTGFRTKPSC